jgi:hypothetical protein
VRQTTTLKFVWADAPVRLAMDFDLLGIAQVLNRAWTRKSKSKAADKSVHPVTYLLGQLKHNMHQGGVVGWLPIPLGWLEANLFRGMPGGLIETVAQALH